MRLIDADAAKLTANDYKIFRCQLGGLVDVAEFLDDMPDADVAPVQNGRWILEETEGGFHIWRCNRCGRGVNDNPEGVDLYCYHCGAKMDMGWARGVE